LQILRALPVPNPNPRWIDVQLDGPAERCEVQIYSVAMDRVATLRVEGALGPGWIKVPMPTQALPAGLYYARVAAFGGRRRSLPLAPLRLVVL